MIRKFTSIFTSVIIFILCTFTSLASEKTVEAGDEIQLLFTIGNITNVSGVSMTALYNSEYLTAENISCNVSGSQTHITDPGEIKWNFIIYDGKEFNNEEVAVVTFKALKTCTVNDIGFSYNCNEMFTPDIQPVSSDPNSMFTVNAVHKGNEYVVYETGHTFQEEIFDNSSTTISENIIESNINSDTDTNINNNNDTDTNTDTSNSSKLNNSSQNTNTSSSSITENKASLTLPTSSTTVSPSTDSAVDTSGSQNMTVILLLSAMAFSVAAVSIANKFNDKSFRL